MSVPSVLGRRVGRGPTDPAVIFAMRRRAFGEQRIAIIHLDDVLDDWTRQVVINEAKRQLKIGVSDG